LEQVNKEMDSLSKDYTEVGEKLREYRKQQQKLILQMTDVEHKIKQLEHEILNENSTKK